ncbi:hypothetical protein ABD72_16870 [Brevibacillus laterosporus]|nr:hypothetical protein BrL25_01615 [Brevibacillus laterosporus DSM 25]MBG9775494.1 hypothetical protein [Brevibacillus laterosporus]MBG9803795.1 hypothetical protein [Brevibacillus laterosporus]TPH21919.1 hypothetical protein EGH09_02795 [Brevibacillus laterosporus]
MLQAFDLYCLIFKYQVRKRQPQQYIYQKYNVMIDVYIVKVAISKVLSSKICYALKPLKQGQLI